VRTLFQNGPLHGLTVGIARRRVSFAPEATLHTWDVVEYRRDSTTSSASTENTQRSLSEAQASAPAPLATNSDVEEPPSTPPEQVEEPVLELGSSPANQRDLHQKKNRRRSSGIPPMNFNNPDDIYSSSPLSGDENVESHQEDAQDKHDGSLVSAEPLESSTGLNTALRQAATHAGTEEVRFSDNEDMTMELVEEDITASFKPWARKTQVTSSQNKDKVDLFSPAARLEEQGSEDEDIDDMSMDITHAIGRIVPQSQAESPTTDDISMDLTMAIGGIKTAASKDQGSRKKSPKRRASVLEESQGSPAKRPASRRASLRQRGVSQQNSSNDDQTMDFTVALGGIQTLANPKKETSHARCNSVETSSGDETMDCTVAMGSIKVSSVSNTLVPHSDPLEDEDMSMEFTKVIGGIRNFNKPLSTPQKTKSSLQQPIVAQVPPEQIQATPQKSPRKPRVSELIASMKPQSPARSMLSTPRKSPGRPLRSLAATPEIPPPSEQIEMFEPSPFVRSGSQSALHVPNEIRTPTGKPNGLSPMVVSNDPIDAPLLNRRRSSLSSVHFSPLAAVREEPGLKSTALLSNNIKLLSTPRKQTLMSPMKRGLTPKKAQTPQKAQTPKKSESTPKKTAPRMSLSPKKRVLFGAEPEKDSARNDKVDEEHKEEEPKEEVDRISLQDFLEMTKIRFMDLSTTKRRHTAAPTAFFDHEVDEKEESLDRYVVAGACTLPEFELYQHACHEMKKYISDGRHFVRTMEANVVEENPLLFSEYLTAPPDQRAVMDNQFKNLKTNARLEARGEWYAWRSTLLRDLKTGLLGTMDGFSKDEKVLVKQEALLNAILPPLTERHAHFELECKQLQQRHDELNSCDREELENTREQLVAADIELAEKRQLVQRLKQELVDKEMRIEAVRERKVECVEETRAAERVREECRGWSTSEVKDLAGMSFLSLYSEMMLTVPTGKVLTLERAHGWSITSASTSTITMTHLNDLELYFQPSAFATGVQTPNASISLAYIGDSATPHPRSLTTSKRFFLQLIRAHLHCIPQSQTRIASLLTLVKNSWATALAVADGVRWLEHNYITEEFILSDERMAISANMLLPTLQTKIKCTFEIGVIVGKESVETSVEPRAELIYGEKYKTDKMSAYLKDFCGSEVKKIEEMSVWADAVVDLSAKLKATGRKGERA
jgi:kinetochore protein Spc7/SPC105